MTLQEALRSGKHFYRCGKEFQPARTLIQDYRHFSVEDALAEDWETEEKKVVITRYQFEAACLRILDVNDLNARLAIAKLTEELGL